MTDTRTGTQDTREAAVAALDKAIHATARFVTDGVHVGPAIPTWGDPAAILDALTPPQRAALAAWLVPAAPVRDADGIAGVVEYDFAERWLVHTEPLGASEIVARDVPSWFGGLVTTRLHPRALPIRVVFPKEPVR